MSFKNLGVIEPILRALNQLGHNSPTEIQKQAIPNILLGKDVMGCAQTGTGKTAAFSIPLLQHLYSQQFTGNKPRALILAPTRELAFQIAQNVEGYSKHLSLRHVVIYGGVSQNNQVAELRKGVDIVIATPGRLLDLMNQGYIDLSCISRLVLDEADSMLDMGFINDVKKILKRITGKKQTLMFSATMPTAIRKFANEILNKQVEISVTPNSSTADKIEQSIYFLEKDEKVSLITKLLRANSSIRTLVFMRTKHGADRLSKTLLKNGVHSSCIHGNKSQNARDKAILSFKSGNLNVLIATDIAARGIDIKELPQVINYDLPMDSETYVHRIGRTGRAGNSGKAISFCSQEERPMLNKIQKLIGFSVPVAQ